MDYVVEALLFIIKKNKILPKPKNSPRVSYVHGIINRGAAHIPSQRFSGFQRYFGFGFEIENQHVRFVRAKQTVQQRTAADATHDRVWHGDGCAQVPRCVSARQMF